VKASLVFYEAWCLFRKGEKAFFVFGFSKNAQDNISDDEQNPFKRAAEEVLALSDKPIRRLIENGQFEEVSKNA
jgi:hypothetical protein